MHPRARAECELAASELAIDHAECRLLRLRKKHATPEEIAVAERFLANTKSNLDAVEEKRDLYSGFF